MLWNPRLPFRLAALLARRVALRVIVDEIRIPRVTLVRALAPLIESASRDARSQAAAANEKDLKRRTQRKDTKAQNSLSFSRGAHAAPSDSENNFRESGHVARRI
jgi:hypothetical protein